MSPLKLLRFVAQQKLIHATHDHAPFSSSGVRLCMPNQMPLYQEKTPGLNQHVLTVLVFWSWVLLVPGLAASCWSPRLRPRTSMCLMAHWTFAGICCSQLSCHPCKNGTHFHMFLQHKGAHTDSTQWNTQIGTERTLTGGQKRNIRKNHMRLLKTAWTAGCLRTPGQCPCKNALFCPVFYSKQQEIAGTPAARALFVPQGPATPCRCPMDFS